MEWEKLFKKYVWDEQTTPYLTPVKKLNRRQADNEILIFSVFIGIFFLIISIIAIGAPPPQRHLGVAVYGFSAISSCIILFFLKSYFSALYLSATPLAVLAYVFFFGLINERNPTDTLIVTIFLLCLLRYGFRIVSITSKYPYFPRGNGEPPIQDL